MEFASEMVIRAPKADLDIREFPIALHPRGGESKLIPFRDGWRHLRLMLVHNPTFLFLLPGVADRAARRGDDRCSPSRRSSLFGHTFHIHTLIGGSLLVVVGTQLLGFGLCGRVYAVNHLGDRDPWLERHAAPSSGSSTAARRRGLTLAGLRSAASSSGQWLAGGLGSLARGAR